MNSLARYILSGTGNGVGGDSPYDFSGLGITNLYSTFKTSLSTIDYACTIKKSNETGNEVYVFYDTNYEISLNSKVSTTTTPGATSLGTFVGSDTYYVVKIFDQITGTSINRTATGAANLVTSGLVESKNSKPSIFFNAITNGSFQGTALTALEDTSDHSICHVAAIDATQTVGVLSTTSDTDTYRQQIYMDTRTNKLVGFIRDDVSGTILSEYLAQQTNTNQRRLAFTVDAQTEFKSYYNSVLQDTDVFTGNYTNDVFRLGAGTSKSTNFKGHWQFSAIFKQTLNQTQVNDLDSKLDNYFSF